jgi:L-amino acid N-acyltransferase
MEIRNTVLDDFDAITAIYNDVLMALDWDLQQPARDHGGSDRVVEGTHDSEFSGLVATVGQQVIGFGTFGDSRAWPGYQFTVKGTIHIDASARGQGVGSALLDALIVQARHWRSTP